MSFSLVWFLWYISIIFVNYIGNKFYFFFPLWIISFDYYFYCRVYLCPSLNGINFWGFFLYGLPKDTSFCNTLIYWLRTRWCLGFFHKGVKLFTSSSYTVRLFILYRHFIHIFSFLISSAESFSSIYIKDNVLKNFCTKRLCTSHRIFNVMTFFLD